jgi:hypothetical protein
MRHPTSPSSPYMIEFRLWPSRHTGFALLGSDAGNDRPHCVLANPPPSITLPQRAISDLISPVSFSCGVASGAK